MKIRAPKPEVQNLRSKPAFHHSELSNPIRTLRPSDHRPESLINSLNSPSSSRRAEWQATLPSLGWLLLFFAAPTLIILVISFRASDHTGGIGIGWTTRAWTAWSRPDVALIVLRTLWISLETTAMCLLLGIPMAWFMARCSSRWRTILLLLVIIPFWTNFLIRVFAWKVLLGHEGPMTSVLRMFHLLGPDAVWLHSPAAVLLVMVYTQLPFAILPLYAAAERFDFSLLDAARDLGATARGAFFKVFLPGIRSGIVAAALMAFVPALGCYLVPDLVGGHDSEMIGNRIARRAFADRNLPEAAALASGLALAVLIPAAFFRRRGREDAK
jgi:spermidine/putrescine transport system permease protein